MVVQSRSCPDVHTLTSLLVAIDVLSRNKILSCPVLDGKRVCCYWTSPVALTRPNDAADGDGKHPVGFLTLDHIMQYVLVSVPNDPKVLEFAAVSWVMHCDVTGIVRRRSRISTTCWTTSA